MKFLFEGQKLKASTGVKKAAIVFNVLVGILVGLSQSGVIDVKADDINATAEHIRSIGEIALPYVLATINVFTHISTTETIGIKKKL